MEWSNPVLADLRTLGGRAQYRCQDGGGPEKDCSFGGEKSGSECWPGGGMPVPLCIMGGEEYS